MATRVSWEYPVTFFSLEMLEVLMWWDMLLYAKKFVTGSREIEPDTGQWEWCTGSMRMSYLGPQLSITGWSWKNVIKKWGWLMLGPWCMGNGK